MAKRWATRFELKPGTWVFVPTAEAVLAGRELKKAITARWKAPDYYYHLASGGHIRALRSHEQNTIFAHLDIDNFFGSINASRITRWLKPLLGYASARQFAIESTVRHPISQARMLPFGFVQSPILASLCLANSALGHKLDELHCRKDVAVSLYVDDIVVSGKDRVALVAAVAELEAAAERSGFRFNAEKRTDASSSVTAFNIVLSQHSLEVGAARHEELIARYNNTDNGFVRRGIAGYLHSVKPTQQTLQLLLGAEVQEPTD